MESPSSKKRVRANSDESASDSANAKRILLLDILDESDACTVSHDLDSFIKSFQDEISPAPEAAGVNSDQPELGFLFEASDDELGLPPTDLNTSLGGDSVELSELWRLDDEFLRYGSFEYGYEYVCDEVNVDSYYKGGDDVAIDGLFDHTDLGFGLSDLSWRSETLPA